MTPPAEDALKFLCLAYGHARDWTVLSKSKQDELLAQDARLRARGDTVEAVAPATTVRAWDGNPKTTPGPFAESSLPLAGFGLIEARDQTEAIDLVSKTPCAVARGAIDVWPVRDLGADALADVSIKTVAVMATVAVADVEAAIRWYGQVLGRPFDDRPMNGAARWRLAGGSGIQLVLDGKRAGGSMVTVHVADIESFVADLASRGIESKATPRSAGAVRLAQITDPDGNLLTFAEAQGHPST
jgi:catechol 2,3-dioxygenase-like lactoylglutathione lyase family enzyme